MVGWARGPILLRRGPRRSPPCLDGLEVLLRQISWWVLRPLVLGPPGPFHFSRRPRAGAPPLPWPEALILCWLNPFSVHEVRLWHRCGVRRTPDLLEKIPLAQNHLVHAARRRNWPHQCRPALELLHDKQRLLALAPQVWVLPHRLLPAAGGGSDAIPAAWWTDALRGDGLVLKPRCGHGGRAVVHYHRHDGAMAARPLFGGDPAPVSLQPGDPSPLHLAEDWRLRTACQETAIAQPYVVHSDALPAADPSVVLRVITERAAPEAPLAVRHAWLEIPMETQGGGRGGRLAVLLLGIDGTMPPIPGAATDPLLEDRRQAWRRCLLDPPPVLAQCLEASLEMHRRLPPIDAVAWDWIPASRGPILLEGNGGFSLLEPQLLDQTGLPR